MKKLFLSGLLLMATHRTVFAQSRSNFAWWNSEVVNALHLSDQQRAQIREIVKSYRPKLIDARAESQKAQGELQDLLASEHFEMVQAHPVIEGVARAQAQVTSVFTEMTLQMRRILTLSQWRELVSQWGTLEKGRRPPDTQFQP